VIGRTITSGDAERLRPYFAAYRRLRQLITELEASPSNSPNNPQHPKHREISSLNPGPAPSEHPITAAQLGFVVDPPVMT
jgi:hypothetical protein